MSNIYHSDIIDIELNSGSVHRSFLSKTIGMNDILANRFGVSLFRNGEPVNVEDLECVGLFMAPDGTKYLISETTYPGSTGTTGNTAFVQLPQDCYAKEGQFCLAIKVIGSDITGTMRIIDGVVSNTGTEGAVGPTSTVPTSAEIIAAYEEAVELMDGAVRHDVTQSISDAGKETARNNIGAASEDDLNELDTEIDNVIDIINIADLSYQQGYYRQADGQHVDSSYFICSTGYVDTTYNKLIEIYNRIETADAIFLTMYNGSTFVRNITFTGSDNMKYIRYIVPNNITKVYVNVMSSETAITPDDSRKVWVSCKNVDDDLKELRGQLRSRFAGKKLSIIGDSIDTFNQVGYKIDGYNMFYPWNDVTDVNKTWWKQVIDNSGMELEVNASWSGSCASNARYNMTYLGQHFPDFYDRVSVLGSPDVIFVTLGTNDSGDSVELGEYDFDTVYTDLSESTFRTAYIKGMKALKELYPDAEIVCIAERMNPWYMGSIRHIARELGAKFVDIGDYYSPDQDTYRLHPNTKGMRQIASAVLYQICKTETSGYETDYTKLEWENGYINGATGRFVYDTKHILTKDFLRVNKGDIIDIRFISEYASGYSFYVVGYDRDLVYAGLLTVSTKAFEVTGFDGYIKIILYHNGSVMAPTEWEQLIAISSAVESVKKATERYNNNERDYISQQDYFEMTYDHTDIIWFEGAYVNQTGGISEHQNAAVTGALRVVPGAYYQMNYLISRTIDCVLSYYDENCDFIGRYAFFSEERVFKIPEACHYVRINMQLDQIKNLTFVRADHLGDTKYSRNDDRTFISKWYDGRYIYIPQTGEPYQLIDSNTMLSDFIPVEANRKYMLMPASPMYTGYYGFIQYDDAKGFVSEGSRMDKTQTTFTTGDDVAFIRISVPKKYFKDASCYIRKIFSKEADRISIEWQNGYHDGDTGAYHSESRFLCNNPAISTSTQKTLDIFKPADLLVKSIFFTLQNADGFVRNISYNYNLRHIRFIVPSDVISVYINIMSESSILPSAADDVVVCLSNDDEKVHFNIVDYVESNKANTNYLINSCSRSNTLPVGLDYNVADIQVAFSASDVSADIVSRGLDAPCVFWDSIEMRWGITFTGYREDSVSEYGSIYAAHSSDLIHWVQDGVILERNVSDPYAPDHGTLGGSYVFIQNGKYYVYYNGGSVRGFEAGNYCICLATGTSLTNLSKHSENPIVIGPDDGNWYSNDKVYRPSVIQWGDGTYYMFMNARNTEHSGSGKWHEYIGFATSHDLVHWEMHGQILEDMPERLYDHYVTGDPCFYDVGDEYIYATLFTCFNETGVNWSNTGVGIMRTPKKEFPYGWKMVKNNITGHPKNKSFVVYKNNVQYAFMVDTAPAIYYRTAES